MRVGFPFQDAFLAMRHCDRTRQGFQNKHSCALDLVGNDSYGHRFEMKFSQWIDQVDDTEIVMASAADLAIWQQNYHTFAQGPPEEDEEPVSGDGLAAEEGGAGGCPALGASTGEGEHTASDQLASDVTDFYEFR